MRHITGRLCTGRGRAISLPNYLRCASIDNQSVIGLNRDTLYSFGVFDLAAGPVTISLRDAGKRFMSLMVIDGDHYVPFVAYDAKPHILTEKNVGTSYAVVAVRTLVNPNDPKDLDEVHELQDAIKGSQKDAGKLELPNCDQTSLERSLGCFAVACQAH